MVKEKLVQVCPICNSIHIHTDNPSKLLETLGHIGNWKCTQCENSFPIPLEIPLSEAKELKKKPLTPNKKL
tara:strand:- start:1858 stop:2070 length:213 start_codon:yes stop_codon:yes gene_type:complete